MNPLYRWGLVVFWISGCAIRDAGAPLEVETADRAHAPVESSAVEKEFSARFRPRGCRKSATSPVSPTISPDSEDDADRSDQTGDSTCHRLLVANAAWNAGDTEVAIAGWRELIESAAETPQWYMAVWNCGAALHRQKRDAEAIPVLMLLLEQDSVLRQSLDKGPIGGFGGRNADSDLDKYLGLNANDWHEACCTLSECYESLGDLEAAHKFALLARDKYPYSDFCGTYSYAKNLAMHERAEELGAKLRTTEVAP